VMRDLHAAARQCLDCADPLEKVRLTHAAWREVLEGELVPQPDVPPAEAVVTPGRPARPRLVSPRDLPKRSLGSATGRAALLHAVAHIEFNAINLAWDAVYRFRDMPRAYYDDWIEIAADEARQFSLICARLAREGVSYWDFEAHGGLWTMAGKT